MTEKPQEDKEKSPSLQVKAGEQPKVEVLVPSSAVEAKPGEKTEKIEEDVKQKFAPRENQQQLVIPELQKIIDDSEKVKTELHDIKKDFFIIFGLFASLVTFFSIEIQILKTINDFWLLLGFSSFLISIILLFTFTLNNIVKDKNKWKDLWSPVFVLILIFLFVSFLFFGIYFRMEIAGFYKCYKTFVY